MILGRSARQKDERQTTLPDLLHTRDAEVEALRRELRRLREENSRLRALVSVQGMALEEPA